MHNVDLKEFSAQNPDTAIYRIEDKDDEDVTVIEHAPGLFRKIRERFGLSEQTLWESLIPAHNVQAIFNFSTGAGKSPSFFFFSDDKRFVIKTMQL